MARNEVNFTIGPDDWLFILLGAVIGYCFLYFTTRSILASFLAGMPVGAGANAVLLPLLKKLRPDLYSTYLGLCRAKFTKTTLLVSFCGMVAISVMWFLNFTDISSRFVIIVFDIYVVVFFIQNRFRKSKD